MSTSVNQKYNGHIYIGLDFGMALTKVAVWAKLAQESVPTRFIIQFPRDNDQDDPQDLNRALHVPSALWIGNGRIYGVPALGTRRLARVDGLKKMLLASWGGPDQLDQTTRAQLGTTYDWSAEKLAILKLALVLRYVDMKLNAWSERTRPGANWRKLINAAVPPESGECGRTSERTQRMQVVIERAWMLAQKISDAESGLALSDAQSLVDSVINLPPIPKDRTPVEVVPEALAAACFRIAADNVGPGDWLTVDVGALTTDTSYFFFNPGQGFRVACYYTLQSRSVGTEQLVRAGHIVEVKGRGYLPHEAIARDPELARLHARFHAVKGGLLDAVKATVVAAIQHQGTDVGAIYHGGRPNFKILLVGGGSTHSALASHIRDWTLKGIGPVQYAECATAHVPKTFQILSAESVARNGTIPETDHPILTVAVGLAQPRIDLPRWQPGTPAPKVSFKDAPDNPYVGHN
jgi:hypothetical protein